MERQGRRDDARNAFERASGLAPGPSLARAAALVREDRHTEAAALVRSELTAAPAADAWWRLPVEPLLNVGERPDVWADVLALLAVRAA
jgi:predicted Zn-dependent protease